ncbi:MAG: hypothetical protein WCH34_14645 [Bacteroidota bacterium]
MEQTNMSASFGHLSKSKSVNLFSNNKEAADVDFKAKEIRSDLSGVALPTHKMKSTSGGDYAQNSNPDFPTTGIEQADALNTNTATTNSRTTNYARNQSQSKLDYIVCAIGITKKTQSFSLPFPVFTW